MSKYSIFSVSYSSRLKTERARKLLFPSPTLFKMKVKFLWDSAQSVGFMLHLLNSHKKYQLKHCDFGRSIGNLWGDSSSVDFLHLQLSRLSASLGKGGPSGRCHVPLHFLRCRGRREAYFPELRLACSLSCLSWHLLTVFGR